MKLSTLTHPITDSRLCNSYLLTGPRGKAYAIEPTTEEAYNLMVIGNLPEAPHLNYGQGTELVVLIHNISPTITKLHPGLPVHAAVAGQLIWDKLYSGWEIEPPTL